MTAVLPACELAVDCKNRVYQAALQRLCEAIPQMARTVRPGHPQLLLTYLQNHRLARPY
jgi:hypothetical protein